MADAAPDPQFDPTVRYSPEALERARQLVDKAPEQIGPYRILERIGHGGMGDVYRAEQRTPVRREVALKFIKLGMDTKAVIARFEAERQALAMMDHPHIAKVFDAGTDDLGRPYFVMEYVKGLPITEYADTKRLTIPQRLRLLEQVCQAIQHAHHKGVIHRDIKPSNVLVSTQDDQPFAKVIDFGVAKALAQQLTEKTLFTQHDQVIGTPQYMSPEQAEGSLDIDTRSDVYSLGVLLYELLSGTPPFNVSELKLAAFEQLKKLIREVDPPAPSIRLSQSGPTLPQIATNRQSDVRRLGPLVRGELDWIVMKALEKDRRRRYETPTSLASDIQAHLQGEAIQAAPPSKLYQLQKLLRRHKGPVITIAAVMVALLLGIAGTTWGLRQAEQSRKETAEVNRELEMARDNAERVLAKGILRSFADGFSDASAARGLVGVDMDQTEINTFLEWCAISDDRLRFRILEVAFDDPATAVRIAFRSPQVVHAVAGISPQRRLKLRNWLMERQRDQAADSRKRIAAAHLSLSLLPMDVPALPELLSPDSPLVESAFDALTNCTTQLSPEQIGHCAKSLPKFLEVATSYKAHDYAMSVIASVAPQLTNDQMVPVCDQMVRFLDPSKRQSDVIQALESFTKIGPWLMDEQVQRCSDVIVSLMTQTKDSVIRHDCQESLAAFQSRLRNEQLRRYSARAMSLFETSTDSDELDAARRLLKIVSARLPSGDLNEHADRLLARLETTQDFRLLFAIADRLKEIGPELSGDQQRLRVERVIALVDPQAKDAVMRSVGIVLRTWAPSLSDEQVQRCWERLFTVIERRPMTEAGWYVGDTLAVFVPRLTKDQVERAGTTFIQQLATQPHERRAAFGIAALAPRLPEEQVEHAAWALLDWLKTTSYVDKKDIALERAYSALGPRLSKAAIATLGDALVEHLIVLADRHNNRNLALRYHAREAFINLAPYLTNSQLDLAWQSTVQSLEGESAGETLIAIDHGLDPKTLEPRLETLLKLIEQESDLKRCEAALLTLEALVARSAPAQKLRAWTVLRRSLDQEKLDRLVGECLARLAEELPVSSLEQALLKWMDDIQREGMETSHIDFFVKAMRAGSANRPISSGTSKRIMDGIERLIREESDDVIFNNLIFNGHSVVIESIESALQHDLSSPMVDKCRKIMFARLRQHNSYEDMLGCDYSAFRWVIRRTEDAAAIARLLRTPRPREADNYGVNLEGLLLERFEEIVLYDRRRMWSARREQESRDADDPQPLSAALLFLPERKFRTVDDAAVWIAKNWPDFDLEAVWSADE